MKKVFFVIVLIVNLVIMSNAQDLHLLLQSYEWYRGEKSANCAIYLFISQESLFNTGYDQQSSMCRRIGASGIILVYSGETARNNDISLCQYYYKLKENNLSVSIDGEWMHSGRRKWHYYILDYIKKNTLRFQAQNDEDISMFLTKRKKI